MHGRWRLVGQRGEVRPAADGFEILGPFESLGNSHDVDGFAALVQVEHGAVDRPVGRPIEVIGLENRRDLDDGVAVDEDRAEHRFLGLETLGRQTVDHGRRGSWRAGALDSEPRKRQETVLTFDGRAFVHGSRAGNSSIC